MNDHGVDCHDTQLGVFAFHRSSKISENPPLAPAMFAEGHPEEPSGGTANGDKLKTRGELEVSHACKKIVACEQGGKEKDEQRRRPPNVISPHFPSFFPVFFAAQSPPSPRFFGAALVGCRSPHPRQGRMVRRFLFVLLCAGAERRDCNCRAPALSGFLPRFSRLDIAYCASLLFTLLGSSAQADYEMGLNEFQNKNYEAAFKYWLSAGKKGLAIALCDVGWLYSKGLGVEKDDQKAFEYMHMAAVAGFPRAQVCFVPFRASERAASASRLQQRRKSSYPPFFQSPSISTAE